MILSSTSGLPLGVGSGVNKPSCTTSGVGFLAAEGELSVEIEKNRVSISVTVIQHLPCIIHIWGILV